MITTYNGNCIIQNQTSRTDLGAYVPNHGHIISRVFGFDDKGRLNGSITVFGRHTAYVADPNPYWLNAVAVESGVREILTEYYPDLKDKPLHYLYDDGGSIAEMSGALHFPEFVGLGYYDVGVVKNGVYFQAIAYSAPYTWSVMANNGIPMGSYIIELPWVFLVDEAPSESNAIFGTAVLGTLKLGKNN